MLITVGDCDAVRVDHAVRFLQLRGGDVNGDFVGVPASQLAVFPGTTHFFGLAKTDLVLGAVLPFLDTPPPKGNKESESGRSLPIWIGRAHALKPALASWGTAPGSAGRSAPISAPVSSRPSSTR
jgi:hypothetical protein